MTDLLSSVPVVGAAGPGWATDARFVLTGLVGVGTFAAMQDTEPVKSRRWICTDLPGDPEFNADGDRWRLTGLLPGQFAPIEFGASPLGVLDCRDAVLACFAAATTAMATGLPYGPTGEILGEVVWTGGQYFIEGGDIEHPIQLKVSAAGGGQGGQFVWQQTPYIVFEEGGFVCPNSQSTSLTWDGITVISLDGTPLRTEDGAGPGRITNCQLRATDGVHSAAELNDTFFAYVENNEFRVVEGADIPVVLINSTQAGGLEGWSFDFDLNRFNGGNGCIEWRIDHSHEKEIGAGCEIRGTVGENMLANAAIVTFKNTHATNGSSFGGVRIESSYIDDSPSDWSAVKIVTEGTGELRVDSIELEGTSHGANGFHVKCEEPGGGTAFANVVSVIGGAPSVDFGGPNGATALGLGSAFAAVGDRTTAGGPAVFTTGVAGEAHDRAMIDATGGLHRFDGTADPRGKLVSRCGHGSPQGVVVAITGSEYTDLDDGTRYKMFPGSVWVAELVPAEVANATTPGSVVKRMRIYDGGGNVLGYVPIYDAIT